MRALIIEDNPHTSAYIAKILKQKNFVSEIVDSGYDALYALKSGQYDIVMLDIDIPYVNGLEVAKQARKSGLQAPIICLSALTTVNEKVALLDSGADDYITKPFEASELKARVAAVIRRSSGAATSLVTFGNIVIDHRTQSVRTLNNVPIDLTNKEYVILELLINRQPSVVSKDVFLLHLYNNVCDEPNAKIVDVFICKLRKKLISAVGDTPQTPKIGTVWGRGYSIYVEPNQKRA